MQRLVFACAILIGITKIASASEQGIASYYYHPVLKGLFAAHKTLPMGSMVRVTNLDNGRMAILKILDRGPFIRGRIIDVSLAAASALGFRENGICHVRLEKI
jgi:rare lipoprotein A